ncbi:MAG TPA: cadherin domain-containing protein, partial [Candidatus Paceibacterota bacterium]|nr:cadherin domain-containing protein [Candidatus Paceibacterota bacterium]
TGTATAVVNIVASNAITATSLRQEIWTNAGSGVAVTDLTALAKYPKRPDVLRVITNFEGVQSFGDNYGSRIRGYVTPTTSGSYRFFAASDDNSQLKFTPTTNALAAAVIASISGTGGWCDYGVWNKFSSQTSPAYSLTAGQKCYLEMIQKEGGGGDHAEAGWTGPGLTGTNIIAASFLSPVDINYAPDLANRVVSVPFTVTNGYVVATLTATDSALDQITYKIVGGNTNGTFAIDPETGRLTVVNNATIAGNLVPSFLLRVQAQDSGYGDLYPRKSTNITVTVQFAESAALTWTGNGTNDNWSEGANWNGVAPIDSSRLVFTGTNRSTNFNDMLTVAGPVTINNGGFQLAGNPLALRADVSNTGDNTWAIDSTLTRPVTINNLGGTLTWSGALSNGGNRLTLSANDAILLDGIVSGTGALVKSGAGTVTLSAANTITGPVTNIAGTLALTGGGSLEASSQLHVMSGAVLDALGLSGGLVIPDGQVLSGGGLVRGNVLINGTLSPGDGIGTLNFENGVTLAGTTLIQINKTGLALTNDLVNTAGMLTLGGSLTVTNTGEALSLGDAFKFFDAASFGGSFASVTLPPVDAGLFWNTATLAADGTIRVAAVPMPQIQVGPWNGSTLTLQFESVEGVTYVLQSSTNLASPITWSDISTNAGNGGVLTVPVPVNPDEEKQFFRLLAY